MVYEIRHRFLAVSCAAATFVYIPIYMYIHVRTVLLMDPFARLASNDPAVRTQLYELRWLAGVCIASLGLFMPLACIDKSLLRM